MFPRLLFGAFAGFLVAHLWVIVYPMFLGYPPDLSNLLGEQFPKLWYHYLYLTYLSFIGSWPWASQRSKTR